LVFDLSWSALFIKCFDRNCFLAPGNLLSPKDPRPAAHRVKLRQMLRLLCPQQPLPVLGFPSETIFSASTANPWAFWAICFLASRESASPASFGAQ